MSEPKDIEALRAQLDGTRGKEYWRSLEALSGTPQFKEFLHREFPQNASEWLDPVGRRGFLKLMSASLAPRGLYTPAREAEEEWCPRAPAEEIVPESPCSTHGHDVFGAGMVRGREPRGPATKIEGNPEHPRAAAPIDIFAQASIPVYDPIVRDDHQPRGEIQPFGTLCRDAQRARRAESKKGAGFCLITDTVGFVRPCRRRDRRPSSRACPPRRWCRDPSSAHAREGGRLRSTSRGPAVSAGRPSHPVARRHFLCVGRRREERRAFASRRRAETRHAQPIYAARARDQQQLSRRSQRLKARRLNPARAWRPA